MSRRMIALLVCVALASASAACSRSGAADLLDTAKLEETQRNLPHARKLYAQIVADYPQSPEAVEAKQRLDALASQGQ